jgi:hypothetical protein
MQLTPQYSREYISWVISQYEQDNEFFLRARKTDYEARR